MPDKYRGYEEIWEILGDGIEEFFMDMTEYNKECARILLGMEEEPNGD